MILYADVLFAINFSMDFIALFICAVILHIKVHKFRIILASIIGAIYGVAGVIVELNTAFNILVCVLFAIIMILTAFPEKKLKRYITLIIMYIFVSACLGGIMSLLYSFFNRILAGFIASYTYEGAYNGARTFIIIGLTAIASIVFGRILTSKKDIRTVELKIKIGGCIYELKGLCDSGNLLKEPFSGKCVVLVSESSKIGESILSVDDLYKKYIPYKDVNGEGLLKGVVPKELTINGNLTDALVATVKNKNFNGYDALVPSALL